ncbi:hypothetical protein N6G95_09740 [Pediococcus inopinatus]|uniref:hypothetical protein n=1 Tax=Pediococcus inopinatus TaxID=114090 RepID=UPI002B25F4C1|nr:hypothetical protein [Pediococcus inopinatus]WPC19484.1 hypothetical protein N6G95_09740 [Pediococcus inopinatus]
MTVKIKDKKVYDSLGKIKWESSKGKIVLNFLKQLYQDSKDPESNDSDAKKVIDAIFNDEEVVLDEQKYLKKSIKIF